MLVCAGMCVCVVLECRVCVRVLCVCGFVCLPRVCVLGCGVACVVCIVCIAFCLFVRRVCCVRCVCLPCVALVLGV